MYYFFRDAFIKCAEDDRNFEDLRKSVYDAEEEKKNNRSASKQFDSSNSSINQSLSDSDSNSDSEDDGDHTDEGEKKDDGDNNDDEINDGGNENGGKNGRKTLLLTAPAPWPTFLFTPKREKSLRKLTTALSIMTSLHFKMEAYVAEKTQLQA